MLNLDPYSDDLLFQCDHCRRVGELVLQGVEDEGQYYCWNCLSERNQQSRGVKEAPFGKLAVK